MMNKMSTESNKKIIKIIKCFNQNNSKWKTQTRETLKVRL